MNRLNTQYRVKNEKNNLRFPLATTPLPPQPKLITWGA